MLVHLTSCSVALRTVWKETEPAMPELEIYLHIIVIYYIHIFYKDEKWGYDGDVMNVINVCKTDN